MSVRAAKPRVVILGAGPAGLGAAWRLHERGHDEFIVLEKNSYPGGLSASFLDPQGFTWDIGGHVLFSHYPYFDRVMDSALAGQWIDHARESHIWISGRFVPYPFQYNLRYLPKDQISACVRGLLEVSKNGYGPTDNFRDWLVRSFGPGIADLFLIPYNFKVWAHPPELMSRDWVGERVATVELEKVLDNIIFERDDVAWGPNNRFRFPKHGGTGAIWNAVASSLPPANFQFNVEIRSVELHRKRVYTCDGACHEYDLLVSTIPLDVLARLTGSDRLIALTSRLKYSATHVVGIGVHGQPPEHLSAKNWMYFPEPACPFYRVTVFSNYSPANVPDPGRYWSLMAEVSESRYKPVAKDRIVADVVQGMKNARLLSAESLIASTWTFTAERGYPIPAKDRDENLLPALSELEDCGVHSRGRFGSWKYEVGNQDHSFMQGVDAAEKSLGPSIPGMRDPTTEVGREFGQDGTEPRALDTTIASNTNRN